MKNRAILLLLKTFSAVLPILFIASIPAVSPEAAELPHGTFSIVARDADTGELGIAVQSRAFNVGQAVPWAEAGVGAIATQASTNEAFGPNGLDLLRSGLSAGETLKWLLANDEGRENRQVGIVDARGRTASHTGEECLDWAGHRSGKGYSIQGNILAGEEVVRAMETAFKSTRGELAVRLIAALFAAQEAGGDKRGKQSAAILVVRPSAEFPEYRLRYVDLRVDDHPNPIRELDRLYRISEGTDLAEAHVRYIDWYASTGQEGLRKKELNRLGEAIRRAVEAENPNASALNGLAWTVATYGTHLPEALQAAEIAVRLEPDSWEVLDTLAEVYFRLGDRQKAIDVERRAARMSPDISYLQDQIKRFQDEEIPE